MAVPALCGWLGHEAPFDFELDYRSAPGGGRMRIGAPPVIGLAALRAALDVWAGVDMQDVRSASIALSELLVGEVKARCAEVVLASPRDATRRGSHLAFRHPNGYAIMRALIARGVIGDFRAPDIMRFGITPLYIGEREVRAAADVIEDVVASRIWAAPEYGRRAFVT